MLLAEIVRHYFPRLVELHNYPPANSTQQKMYNWNTLNSKVLRKMGYNLYKDDIEAVIQCRPGQVEKVRHGTTANLTTSQPLPTPAPSPPHPSPQPLTQPSPQVYSKTPPP